MQSATTACRRCSASTTTNGSVRLVANGNSSQDGSSSPLAVEGANTAIDEAPIAELGFGDLGDARRRVVLRRRPRGLIGLFDRRHVRELAVRAARDAVVPLRVVDADAEELPFAAATFDAAVASLALCSVADVSGALAELHRVLRPDAELRFFEHVASPRPALRMLQRAPDATVWPRLSGGCRLARESDRLIEVAGFAVERCDRFTFRVPPVDPPKTHVLGVARRLQAPRRPAA
jgi:SAM-dependent methyltransferase